MAARLSLLPAYPHSHTVCRCPSHASITDGPPGSESGPSHASACSCARGLRLSTPGVLGSDPSSVVSIHPRLLRPHAPVPQARCDFASRLYAAPSLCGSASATHGTFPTFATVLSVHVADPIPVAHRALPLYSHGDSRLPRTINESPPTTPSLPAISDGLFHFGTASFALCYKLHVCLALLTGYDGMKSRVLHHAL